MALASRFVGQTIFRPRTAGFVGAGFSFLSKTQHSNLFLSFNICRRQYSSQTAFNKFSTNSSIGSNMGSANNQAVIVQQIDDVIKSTEDKRAYRIIHLNNGMKVLLISDPTTEKAAASMDVNIGHLRDPRNLPGLAHFCEHMLFLGTDKYPVENEYSKFLANHGGSSNAYTASDRTNYFFDVAHDKLKDALDIFAQFFLAPQFTESATDREVNAVDSENQNYQKEDMWRLMQLERSLSDPQHDFSKFGTGSRVTLWDNPKKEGLNPRDELIKFHSSNYSSNIMRLCIVGKESLDELTKMATDMFADVKNKSVEPSNYHDHPWGPKQVSRQIDVVPVKDIRQLCIAFPIPDLNPYYRSQPGHYISHLIGHEGPGSLLSLLKAKGWVSNLSSGPRSGAKGFGFFSVDVDLSEEGLKHTDEIVYYLFNYLTMLNQAGPQKWVHDECQQLSDIKFKFKDKTKPQATAHTLSAAMQYYEDRDVLYGPFAMTEYKPELITEILGYLKPTNFTTCRVSKTFHERKDLKREKWYGTEYAESPFADDFKSKCAEAFKTLNPELALPKPNPFIPSEFAIKTGSGDKEEDPKVIHETSWTRLWHKLDQEFLMPKAVAYFNLSSPVTFNDPTSQNLAYMYSLVLTDALTEFAYDASLGGLGYSVSNARGGMTLNVAGYNHKLGILLEKIMSELANLKVDPKRFDVLKEGYVRGLKNWTKEKPYQQAISYTSLLTLTRGWSKVELLADVEEEVTVEALEAFIPKFLKQMHIEAMIYGNVSEEEAKEMVSKGWAGLESRKKVRPLYPGQITRDREYEIPKGTTCSQEFCNPVHSNSATEILYQIGTQEELINMKMELLVQILREPAFDQLRTKESLGYIVFSGIRMSAGVSAIRFIVQGEQDPIYVESRVELFIQNMRQKIAEMDDKEFEENKEALAVIRSEKPKKLTEKAGKFWSEISRQIYNFKRDDREVKALRTLTKQQILDFYDQHLLLSAPERRKLVTNVLSTAVKSSHSEFESRSNEKLAESLKELKGDLPKGEKVTDRNKWQIKQRILNHPEPLIELKPKGLVLTDEDMPH